MSELFADSFAFIALLNPHDQHHDAVKSAFEHLNRPMVTTQWVLVEVADALGWPGMRPRVAPFLRRLAADANTTLIPPDPALFERGLELYDHRPDKAWSLTDCLSFVVMSDRRLTDALTGDHHFEQAGFRALLRQA